jgi:hypothetical protein
VECPGISAYADGDFACTLPAEISVARGSAEDAVPGWELRSRTRSANIDPPLGEFRT